MTWPSEMRMRNAARAWLVRTGARMVTGGHGGPRPCWEHRLLGRLLLRSGLLLM